MFLATPTSKHHMSDALSRARPAPQCGVHVVDGDADDPAHGADHRDADDA